MFSLALSSSHTTQAHWAPLPLSGTITTLAIDPLNPATLYAGVYQGIAANGPSGVARSLDGGISWGWMNQGIDAADLPYVTHIVMNPSLTTTLHLAARHVYRSSDGGATWVPATSGLPDGFEQCITSLVLDPTTPTTLYISYVRRHILSSCPSGLYRSTDDGITWQPLSAPFAINTLCIDPSRPTLLYAGLASFARSSSKTGGGVARSQDGGVTWQKLPTGLPDGEGVPYLVLDPRTPTLLYASTVSHGMLRTTTGGDTWDDDTAGLPTSPSYSVGSLFIDPRTAIVYAGTAEGLFWKTSPDGKWLRFGGKSMDGITTIASSSAQLTTLYIGTLQGLYIQRVNQNYLPTIR